MSFERSFDSSDVRSNENSSEKTLNFLDIIQSEAANARWSAPASLIANLATDDAEMSSGRVDSESQTVAENTSRQSIMPALLSRLGSDNYRTREQATREISQQGLGALLPLLQAQEQPNRSLEATRRIQLLTDLLVERSGQPALATILDALSSGDRQLSRGAQLAFNRVSTERILDIAFSQNSGETMEALRNAMNGRDNNWQDSLVSYLFNPDSREEVGRTYTDDQYRRGIAAAELLQVDAMALKQHYGRSCTLAGDLTRLASEQNIYVRRALAGNPQTPTTVLTQLAGEQDSLVSCSVATNPNTPTALLTRLAGEQDSDVRRSVATNPNTPTALLTRLAGEQDSDVRCSVAGNPNTPTALLTRLAGDQSSDVRCSVARNPNTSTALLTQLAGDKNGAVRRSVAFNLNTSTAALTLLAGDQNSDVRCAVAFNLNTPTSDLTLLAAADERHDVREAVGRNVNTPPAALTLLAADARYEVRGRVADNPSTPSAVLTRLAADHVNVVRSQVAANPNTPSDVLTRLAADECPAVQFAAQESLSRINRKSP